MSTPIQFGTDGWRAVIARDFTFANLSRVTAAFAQWALAQTDAPKVLIGHDARFLGQQFAEQVAIQLAQAGVKVFLAPGVVSTPMVSLATLQRQCTAGIVLTASHNPPEYNGFKVKAAYGGPASPNIIADIEGRIPEHPVAVTGSFEALIDAKQIEYYDAEALYINHVKQAFDWGKIRESGIRFGYDAMYGAGMHAVRRLFPHATLLHATPNPGFDGQAPEPIERNLAEFQALIRESGIQFGLATDGDADRIGLFDETGAFVDSHTLMLLLIHYLHKYKGQGGKVVTTFSATGKIGTLCEAYGLPIQITKIGFKYIGEIMVNEDVLVGGEESGGIAVKGHIPERDGIYIGLVLLEFMAHAGKSLTELVQEVIDVVGPFAMDRNDLHVPNAQKHRIMEAAHAGEITAFGDYTVQSTESLDGVKFHLGADRWVMLRPSGTEPVLRVYGQAEDRAAVQALLAQAVGTVTKL